MSDSNHKKPEAQIQAADPQSEEARKARALALATAAEAGIRAWLDLVNEHGERALGWIDELKAWADGGPMPQCAVDFIRLDAMSGAGSQAAEIEQANRELGARFYACFDIFDVPVIQAFRAATGSTSVMDEQIEAMRDAVCGLTQSTALVDVARDAMDAALETRGCGGSGPEGHHGSGKQEATHV